MHNEENFSALESNETDLAKAAKDSQKSKKTKELFEWLEVVSAALICVIILFGFVFRVATISGSSMLDTLHHKEMIVMTNFFYTPKAGDIVVISRNAENTTQSVEGDGPIIKRVIATENQTVDIRDGSVYVDGNRLEEDNVFSQVTEPRDVVFPVTVPEGHIFVLGDNRAVSFDSRYSGLGENGMIDERYVLGHAVFRIFPFKKMGSLTNK